MKAYSDENPPLSGREDGVALIVPFIGTTSHDSFVFWFEKWLEVGEVCSMPSQGIVDLVLYVSRRKQKEARAVEKSIRRLLNPGNCFRDIRTIYFKREEQAFGTEQTLINAMFFDLFEFGTFPGLRSFMWMDHQDVTPIKARWLDAIVSASKRENFWMLGSIQDEASNMSNLDAKTNHINRNALYSLRDAGFKQFLSLVVEREPLTGDVPGFDVLLWKVLTDPKYSAPLYQKYNDRFKKGTFIDHSAPSMTSESVVVIKTRGSSTASRSPDQEKYMVPPHMQLSILMRSFSLDLSYAALAFQSAQNFIPHALEYVLVVPEADVQAAREKMPAFVQVYGEPILMDSQGIQQQYTKMMADTYTRGKFVLHLDSDVVIFRDVFLKDLFLLGKPILRYDRYENLPEWASIWRNGASYVMGYDVPYEFMRSNDLVFPRHVYALARAFVEKRFETSFLEFMRTRRAGIDDILRLDKQTVNPSQVDTSLIFSEYNFLGAFLFWELPGTVALEYSNIDPCPAEAPQNVFHLPSVVNRPPIICQGNARWTNTGNVSCSKLVIEQFEILKNIASGTESSCDVLQTFLNDLTNESCK
jgi:hypothetical protein